jgi:hypothetical protein
VKRVFELTGAGVLVTQVLAKLALGVVALPAEDALRQLNVASE